ncbi:MAG: rod shape-determining protein RodA [Parcubacteria group bacterium]|nr:rod shape-determining protein RodA [Parcubacteria group bacterium]
MRESIVNVITSIFGRRLEQASHIDWILFFSALLISLAGLVTMNSFASENFYFQRQVIWILISVIVFFICSFIDFRFLRRTWVVVSIFSLSSFVLIILFVLGHVVKGAQSWFDLGFLSFQPSDPIKLVVILILAKYFTRRHIEIANIRHILVSGFYVAVIFLLVFLQPDFGSAIIIFLLWLGMVLVSGISKKHLLAVFFIGLASFFILWSFVFQDYQKQRIVNFVYPLADIRGTGYNAYQSTIAVGSGKVLGKGIGYGTQSKLKFLPEYETDFIFAAFAEEWGFVGVIILFALFGVVIWRILRNAIHGDSNFEILFGMGLAILFMVHFIIHVGMNIGLLPVTGTTIPFMSYGGSHLLTEFTGLGILMGMRKYRRTAHKDMMKNEFLGI